MFDLTGRQLGKYQINERLGRGGMATVYRAYQPGIDRFVAIKVIHLHFADDPTFIERFRREARAVGALRHPNIVQVIDFDTADGMYYMVMEYLQGETLKARLQRVGALPVPEALTIGRKLADAVSYAHTEGMLHRDIKPANVIFAKNGEPILTDFGIAKLADSTGLTASGSATGTPAYMSPEAGRGEKVDERSDVYSLGVVLYEMLTGALPFDADTPYAVIQKHNFEPLPSPRKFRPDLPAHVEMIVIKALAKQPAERYPSAADLRDALDAAKSTQLSAPTKAMPITPPATPPAQGEAHDLTFAAAPPPNTVVLPPRKRSPLPIIGGIVAVMAIVAGGLFVVTRPTDPTPTPRPTQPPNIAMGPTQVASDGGQATDTPTGTPIPLAAPPETALPIAQTALPTVPTLPPTAIATDRYGELRAQVIRLVKDGLLEASLSTVNAALSTDAESYDLRALKATILMYYRAEADKLAEGRQIAELLIAAAPDRPEAYFALGFYFHYSPNDNPERAESLYTQAIERGSTDPLVYQQRAIARISLGRPREEVLADYDRAISLAPAEPENFRLRGSFNYDQRQFAAAETDFVRYNDMAPSIGNHELLGRAYLQQGKKAEAFRLYADTIAKEKPNEPYYLAQAGFVAWETGNTADAQTWIDRTLALEPDNAPAQYVAGLLDQGAGRLDAALQRFETLHKMAEIWRYDYPYLNPDFGRALNYDLGNVFVELKRPEDAEKAYARAIEVYGYWPIPYIERARVLNALQRKDEAREVLRAALELEAVRADPELEKTIFTVLGEVNATPAPTLTSTPRPAVRRTATPAPPVAAATSELPVTGGDLSGSGGLGSSGEAPTPDNSGSGGGGSDDSGGDDNSDD